MRVSPQQPRETPTKNASRNDLQRAMNPQGPPQMTPPVRPLAPQFRPPPQPQAPQGPPAPANPTAAPAYRPAFRPPGPPTQMQPPQGAPAGAGMQPPQHPPVRPQFRPPPPSGLSQQPHPQQPQQLPQQPRMPPQNQQFPQTAQIQPPRQQSTDSLASQFGKMGISSPPSNTPHQPPLPAPASGTLGGPVASAAPGSQGPPTPGGQVPGLGALGASSAAAGAARSKRVYPGMPASQPSQQQIPQQQMQQPGPVNQFQQPQSQQMSPQQSQQPQFQQPGMPPQQFQQPQFQQPGMPPPQQFQQPGMPPPQQFQQPGMPPQQFQQPGMPPPQQFQQPGMQQPQQFQQPGMQQQMQNPMMQQQQQASKHRINPDHIPSPVAMHEADQNVYSSTPYMTMSRTVPPLAASRFTVFDNGNSSPKFIRSTLYNIPATEELLNTSVLPFGIVLQPLADTDPGDSQVPLADFGAIGPVRCSRCKAYVNPFFQFIQGGRKFVCNMCAFENDVPNEYFENLDMNGRRIDINQRPELLYGSCDFTVTPEYIEREPKPAGYVFAIDVSFNAIRSGMLATCAAAIKHFLYSGEYSLPTGATIGIITFDRAVHFYNLKPTLDKFQMMVVGDVSEMFVPLSQGMLVDPIASKAVIEGLLDALPVLFSTNTITEAALGAACQAAMEALVSGGKLSIFQTSLPMFGPGALKNREDPKILGSDRENKLYEPQEYFWRKLGEDCVGKGVCVDSYFFPNAYIDVATSGALSAITGGDTAVYTNFDANRDGDKFANDLQRTLARRFGFDAILRVRVSNGLKVANYYGNFMNKNNIDVEFGGLDSLKAIAVALKHESKLDDKNDAYIQAALLYTTVEGHRRVRVHNLSLPITSQLTNVFRQAEMDTSINLIARVAISETVNLSLKTIRDNLTTRCVKVLASYRINISTQSSPGQLILPESYKLYPLYVLSLTKTRALRGGKPVPSDLRVYSMRVFNTIGVAESVAYLYPTMYDVTEMDASVGDVNAYGLMKLPAVVRMSVERMSPQGIYLAENGRHMFLWIGQEVAPQRLRDVFGVDSPQQVATSGGLPLLESQTSSQLRTIVAYLQGIRPRFPQLTVVRQGIDMLAEVRFSNLFVEDAGQDALSYVDFLVLVHKNVQSEASSAR